MNNINDLFEVFPDYNVFDDESAPSVPQSPPDNGRQDTDNNRDVSRHSEDYGDGFGIYKAEARQGTSFSTFFFFPFLMLWLEITLRLSCNQTLMSASLVYILLFSLAPCAVLTLLCTFMRAKANRHMCRILTLVITLWYCFQMVYFNVNNMFFAVSNGCPMLTFDSFAEGVQSQKFYIIATFVPLIIAILLGRFIFPFKKTRVGAKLVLIFAAILLQIIAYGSLNLAGSVGIDSESYSVHSTQSVLKTQESFGLISMQELDFITLITSAFK